MSQVQQHLMKAAATTGTDLKVTTDTSTLEQKLEDIHARLDAIVEESRLLTIDLEKQIKAQHKKEH